MTQDKRQEARDKRDKSDKMGQDKRQDKIR